MKQTAVEWIQQQIRTKGITHDLSIGEILDKAKIMEKYRLEMAFTSGYIFGNRPLNEKEELNTDAINQWYEKTYGG